MSDKGKFIDIKPIKTWCYKAECGPIVQTGWLTQFYACSTCKLEVSEQMYKDYLDKQKKKNEPKPESEDEFPWGIM